MSIRTVFTFASLTEASDWLETHGVGTARKFGTFFIALTLVLPEVSVFQPELNSLTVSGNDLTISLSFRNNSNFKRTKIFGL